MSLPSNFVKQTYDRPNEKGYATADTYFLDRVCEIIEEYKITKVIEAGTYEGRSTTELSFLVDEVIGIEINQEYVNKTTDRLINNSRSNYKIFKGNSPDIIPLLASEFDLSHTIFFLDAHMSATGGAFGQIEEREVGYWPILDEIKALPRNKGIIIVHDIYVPKWGDLDKNDSNRLGYDTYIVDGKKQRFDYDYIKDTLMEWSPSHRIEYNKGTDASGDQRGIAFIYSK